MSEYIELSIDTTEACASIVTRRAVARIASTPVDAQTDLEACLRALLASVPHRPWRRTRVRVTLGGRWRQLRRIEGLPPLDDMALATQVVRENVDAFFLASAGGLRVAELARATDGTVWGAAFAAADVERIEQAIRQAHCVLMSIVASGASADGEGGSTTVETRCPRPLALRPTTRRLSPRLRRAIAGTTLLLAGFVAFAAPGLRALLILRLETSPHYIERARLATEFRRSRSDLRVLRQFDDGRGAVSRLLVDVAGALPDGAAITSLRIDSTTIAIALVAERLDVALERLGGLEGWGEASIIGATTLEHREGRTQQRATAKLTRRPSAPAEMAPTAEVSKARTVLER